MTPIFKKLNFKNQKVIVAYNYPKSFETDLLAMQNFATIVTELKNLNEIEFGIFFVSTQKEIDFYLNKIISKLKGDAILWFCYPKASSKKYKCEFNGIEFIQVDRFYPSSKTCSCCGFIKKDLNIALYLYMLL